MSHKAYADYYDKNFPSDVKKRCDESKSLIEDYKKYMNPIKDINTITDIITPIVNTIEKDNPK